MSNKRGVTLIELIIVIAFIGIIAALVTIDTEWLQKEGRVTEARDRLLADIEEAKLKSLAQVPHAIFLTCAGTSYTVRSLTDDNSNFKKDTGEADTVLSTVSLSTSTNVKVRYNTTCTAGNTSEIWFDRKGMPRTSTWSTLSRTLYVWYDADGDNIRDDDEIKKRIDVEKNGGKIQYEQ